MTELRKALGEKAKAPQWIAKVHQRGYRFMAPVNAKADDPQPECTPSPVAPLSSPVPALVIPLAPVPAPTPAPRLVGREAEVATLHQWFAKALQGFFFSSRRRHTRCLSDWSSDVCSSDLARALGAGAD